MYLVLVLPLLMLSFGECEDVNKTQSRNAGVYPSSISVTNGQPWGAWGDVEWCPAGTYATGFSLLVDPYHGIFVDDTALNGIAVFCSKPISSNGAIGSYTMITSSIGSWGSWTPSNWCPSGVLTSFQLNVQSYQGRASDDSAASNIRFSCSSGTVLVGKGMDWGSWSSSDNCGGTGICGIQTRVEPPQGSWDDTSLNNVIFYCCN